DHHGTPALASALHGEHGRDRRLADPAGAGADHDLALGDDGAQVAAHGLHPVVATGPPSALGSASRPPMPSSIAVASMSSSSGPMSVENRKGRCSWGSGSRLASRSTWE